MKEEVFCTHYYKGGIKISNIFLDSLEDVFRQYNKSYKLEINVECNNKATYQFDNFKEMNDFFQKKPFRIIDMEIMASFGNGYDSNRVKLSFYNGVSPNVKVNYHFNSVDDYSLQKEKIENCMKNYRLNYYILSKIPIITVISTFLFVGLCLYTYYNNIIYTKTIQNIISVSYILICMLSPIINTAFKIKQNLFPCVEFRIGQNEIIEENNERWRSFFFNSFVCALILGIITSAISSLFF